MMLPTVLTGMTCWCSTFSAQVFKCASISRLYLCERVSESVSRNFDFKIDLKCKSCNPEFLSRQEFRITDLCLLSCHHVIMQTCQHVNLAAYHFLILSLWHLLACPEFLSACQYVNMSIWQHVNLATCQHANMSTGQQVNKSTGQQSTG